MDSQRSRSFAFLTLAIACAAPLALGQHASPTTAGCQPEWIRTFGGYPFPTTYDGTIRALAAFDDGHGPALYAAGDFPQAESNYLSKWDGWGWTSLGAPIVGNGVRALAVFDDGSGPALYIGGGFTSIGGIAANHIAKWDGTTWSALGSGTNSTWVNALHVFDDGSGPALYVGGEFTDAGGIPANNLARWNGSGWSAVPTGTNGGITALSEFDDGSGNALYAGGLFTTAGGLPCQHIAKWDGTSWSALGNGTNGAVYAMTVFDDGSGPALFLGGSFTVAGSYGVNRITKWDGTHLWQLGVGMNAPVYALAVFDDGSGSALYAGGAFTQADGHTVYKIGKWNGASWSLLPGVIGTGSGTVYALLAYDDGSGLKLQVAGHFYTQGNIYNVNIASWSSSGWSRPGFGLDGTVSGVVRFDDGTGPALYAVGGMSHAGPGDARGVVKWDGSQWRPLPDPQAGLRCMVAFDDGSGPALYCGGSLYPSSAQLTRWNGSNWSVLGSGQLRQVDSLLVFDDGSGPALFAASSQVSMTGIWIGKWNGTNVVPLSALPNAPVWALAAFDDGSGPALYAGGRFASAGGVTVNGVARWNGSSWTALGSGIGDPYFTVTALCGFDDGTGPALYAAGSFSIVGGVPAQGIAKWNGSSWSALGSGLASNPVFVTALVGYDDGNGPRLYVAGQFTTAGGIATGGFATWDGANWADASSGFESLPSPNALIRSLSVVEDPSPTGRALFVGGNFGRSPSGDSVLAKWDLPLGCMPLGSAICSPGTAGVMPCPCGNPPSGIRLGCDNSSSTGGAQVLATGLASLSNDLVLFTTSGETPSALSIVLQGTSETANGLVFGQGVRCVSGALLRLYARTAVLGSITAPEPGDDAVHRRSAALGDTIAPGSHRYYGVYYRDPVVLGGCPAASTFNITQQMDLLWTP